MIADIIKMALEKMDKQFTSLSRLKFDEIDQERKEILIGQKIQERPFAYEFYHQFRLLDECGCLEDRFPEGIVLQAEVHKGYQRILGIGERMPDFLFHKPSSMENNLAVVEFKMASRHSELPCDFDKLVKFKTILNYEHIIEVIIGDTSSLDKARKYICNTYNPDAHAAWENIVVIEFDTDSWQATYQ